MKLGDIIKHCEELMEEYGDLPVFYHNKGVTMSENLKPKDFILFSSFCKPEDNESKKGRCFVMTDLQYLRFHHE